MNPQHPLLTTPMGIALHELVYGHDRILVDFYFREVNKAFEELAGLSAQSLVGKTFLEVLPMLEKAGFHAPDRYLEWVLRAGAPPF